MIKNKEKIPSQSSVWLSPIYNINRKYINLSKRKCCGRAENRTRNCRVTTNCFATKILAHNDNNMNLNYIKLSI